MVIFKNDVSQLGGKMVKKLPYFPFASSAEKYFQLSSTEIWWKTFPLYRFWTYTEVKDSTLFSTVLPALARKLHPCYLLFHLLSSCRAVTVLFQSSFYFRMKGVLLGI